MNRTSRANLGDMSSVSVKASSAKTILNGGSRMRSSFLLIYREGATGVLGLSHRLYVAH